MTTVNPRLHDHELATLVQRDRRLAAQRRRHKVQTTLSTIRTWLSGARAGTGVTGRAAADTG